MFSPMEQYEIFPISGVFNNVVIFMLMACSVVPLISYIASRKEEIVPSSYGIVNESLYKSVLSMVHDYVGVKVSVYFPLIYTIFNTI
jgi:F0F1-type ATP synthase membrane subunit a